MRIYLSPELRRPFHRAWGLVPACLHTPLGSFLRSVREVKRGGTIKLRLSDGSSVRQGLVEGPAAMFLDSSLPRMRGWILLRSDLSTRPEAIVTLFVLHEIAHALRALEDPARAEAVAVARAEIAAWMQAGAWAAHAPPGEDTQELVDEALYRAWEEHLEAGELRGSGEGGGSGEEGS
ncbi:MAG TPA: hypothetical protein VK399_06205 [Longimicrobiaceae bacterium]|nr:hypothetical protein [Longimicrobiaceae bacterium]